MVRRPAKFSDGQEAEMAYERLDQALRQLKTDRERAEATENQQKKAGAEARIRFARIKSAVIGPIFNEVVARLVLVGPRQGRKLPARRPRPVRRDFSANGRVS